MNGKKHKKIGADDDLAKALDSGDHERLDQLVQALYPELKQLAHYQLSGERAGHTLSTTAIVNEAFVRMRASNPRWTDQAHFFRIAARVMRHLLVDHARKRSSQKRGSGVAALNIEDVSVSTPDDSVAVLAINDAMLRIEAIDQRMAQVVECRFFAGLSVKETSDALGISVRTVERAWQRARAYIHRALAEEH